MQKTLKKPKRVNLLLEADEYRTAQDIIKKRWKRNKHSFRSLSEYIRAQIKKLLRSSKNDK